MTNRFRLWVILSVLSLAACTSQRRAAPDLPKSISPGWRMERFVRDTAANDDEWQSTYTGPGTANVRIRAISGQAAGVDLWQKWRPRANTVVFYSDRYFTSVAWSGASAAQARALVNALERALQ